MQTFPSFLTHLGFSLATAITLLTENPLVVAQAIQSDNTLSNNGFTDSVVNPMGDSYTITGGTEMGANLFHSFLEFSVPNFGRAFFDNNLGIENIISRVTGANISTIEGIIQANGAANLFLINPNGITIGPNAGLDIGGSFVASTADSIEFFGGGRFSAANPNGNGTLLTMTAPLGLQMGTNPGQITVEGFGNNLDFNNNTFEIVDLSDSPNLPPGVPGDIFILEPFAVKAGETLALVGGDIVFDGGNVEAVQGRVELAAFSNGLVNFTTVNGQLQISPPTAGITYQDISLSGASSVDVSGNSGGSVQVQGQNLILNDGSVILANTTGNGSGGEITVTTTESIQADGVGVLFPPIRNSSGFFAHRIFSGIFAHTSSQSTPNAQGGSIRLNTGQLIVTDGAQIGANTYGLGQGGQLTVNANTINVSGAANLNPSVPSGLFTAVAPNASGSGGRLSLNTQILNLTGGANVSVSTFAGGNGGTANIQANQINISGTSEFTGQPTGIFGNVEADAIGQGGNLSLTTQTLNLSDGGNINFSTFGSGNAGTANIQASNINISGISTTTEQASGIFSNVQNNATGQGGNLSLTTQTLNLRDGGNINLSTSGSGNAGNANIQANNINISGISPSTGQASGIFSNVGTDATGQGGNLSLTTQTLNLRDGGNINFSTSGSGNAGNANIQASDINISGISPSTEQPSGIFSNVETDATGQGGSLSLTTQSLNLSDGANINFSTFGSGNAGTINIQAEQIQLTGTSAATGQPTGILNNVENNATGQGGRVEINAGNLQLREGAQIGSLTFGSGNAGTLTVRANSIDIQGTSSTRPSSIVSQVGRINQPEDTTRGNGGNIFIDAHRISLREGGIISTNTAGLGQGGNIEVKAETIEVLGGTPDTASGFFSAVSAQGRGNGGQIRINTGNLLVKDGGQIAVSTEGFGNGGNLNITAKSIELLGSSSLGASGLFANAIVRSGDGGNINLLTENLTIADGATINVGNFPSITTSRTPGTGSPGNITIEAQSVRLNNQGSIQSDTLAGTQGNINIRSSSIGLNSNSRISTNAQGDGSGGTIDLTTNNLNLNTSEITANATGSGSAGNVNINPLSQSQNPQIRLQESQITATGNQGNIRITSDNLELNHSSRISANAEGDGDGGNVTITNDHDLTLREGSEISTNAQGRGQGGNIEIVTGSSTVASNSQITSNASAASGGNINLRVTSPSGLTLDNGTISATGGQGNITVISPITFLRNGSLISTNGIGTEPGGNIIINTDFVLSIHTENNDITANAQQSFGGRVIINALGVFGIKFREFLTPLSDITVTSELGPAFRGEVLIRVPEGDPTSAFTKLPEDPIDVSDLIVITCAADEGSIFIRTGRGGIPDNPEQPLRQPIIWEDLRDFIELEEPKTEPSSQSNTENLSLNCSFHS